MVKKRGLGKSLDALLSYKNREEEQVTPAQDVNEGVSSLPITQIIRGKYQPRREFDLQSLENLADSIRSQGIIQPLIVRPINEHQYEIIAGERRFRAAQIAGLTSVPVVIRDIPDEAALAIALIENIQREDLNPIEEAVAINRLIEELGMTHQEAAASLGKSRASISNLLRLLALPDEVKEMLEKRVIEMGHARTLITLPENLQFETAQLIVARQLSVRETETLVRRLQNPNPAKSATDRSLDPDIFLLQEKLAKQLKLRVAIQCNAKGRGKLVIHYRSLGELDHILNKFQD